MVAGACVVSWSKYLTLLLYSRGDSSTAVLSARAIISPYYYRGDSRTAVLSAGAIISPYYYRGDSRTAVL